MTVEHEQEEGAHEWRAAQRRIGRSTAKAFRWLLDFAQQDLRTLSQGQWPPLRYEVAVTTNRLRVPGFGEPPDIYTIQPWTDFGVEAPLPTEEQILALQKTIKRHLDEFVETGHLAISAQHIQFAVRMWSERHERAVLQVDCDDPMTSWNLTIIDLLSRHGSFLRRCREPKCRRLFHAQRRTQWYHSRTCNNRAAQRTWQKKLAAKKATAKAQALRKRHRDKTMKGGKHHGTKR